MPIIIMNSKTRLLLVILFSILDSVVTLKVKLFTNEQNNRPMTAVQLQTFQNVKLVLDGSNQYIYPESNNIFNLPSLTNGIHIIEAISNEYLFPVLIVEVRNTGPLKMKWLNSLDRKFIKYVNEPFLSPLQKIKYFEPEPSLPIMSFLMGGNSLFIIMGVLMVLCYKGMNKLAEAQMAPNTQSPEQHAVSGNRGKKLREQ